MQYKVLLLVFVVCVVSTNARPIVESRSTLSDNPAEVFESISPAKFVEESEQQSSEPPTEEYNEVDTEQSTEPDAEQYTEPDADQSSEPAAEPDADQSTEPDAEQSTELDTEQSSAESTDPDVEAIVAETEARVNAIINHGSYY